MDKIASEVLIETAGRLGCRHDLRAAGRRHQRPVRGSAPQDRIRFVLVHHEEAAAFMAPATPRPPAGSGSAWPPPVPGHAPAQRPVRRQARPPAGAGHHRHAGDRRARHRLPAGGPPGPALHGRRRLQPDDHDPAAVPGVVDLAMPDRAGPPHRGPSDLPERRAGRRRRRRPVPDMSQPARPPATRRLPAPAPRIPGRRPAWPGREVLNAGTQVAILAGPGALHAGGSCWPSPRPWEPDHEDAAGKAVLPDD